MLAFCLLSPVIIGPVFGGVVLVVVVVGIVVFIGVCVKHHRVKKHRGEEGSVEQPDGFPMDGGHAPVPSNESPPAIPRLPTQQNTYSYLGTVNEPIPTSSTKEVQLTSKCIAVAKIICFCINPNL